MTRPTPRLRGLRWLLGDPMRPDGPLPTVTQWVDDAERARVSLIDESITLTQSLMDPEFEAGCALLHDSRLLLALDRFRGASLLCKQDSAGKILARLGSGRALSALRRYAGAETALKRAVEEARTHGEPSLLAVARVLYGLNASDWHDVSAHEAATYSVPVDVDEPLKTLIAAYQALVSSRIHLRNGRRTEAIKIVESALVLPEWSSLPRIPRGLIIRMYGILHAVTGNPAAARANLEDAVGIFREAGYQVGEVDAVLSLARVHAPVDRQQTHLYLSRAREILEETDFPGRAPRPGARQMPGARAAFFSREAEFEFARGNYQQAYDLYRKDLELTTELAGPRSEDAPRALAYVHRHMGRVCLAIRAESKAVEHLEQSVGLFRKVNDSINAFFSETLLCEAYFASGDDDGAQRVLEGMETLVRQHPDRVKEAAIVQVLRAQAMWRSELDPESALATLREARLVLRQFGRDYYYVRLLLTEAEVLIGCRDDHSARWRLREARSCALSLEMEDMRRRAEELLTTLGASLEQVGAPEGRLDLAIFFADIRGFTDASRRVEATTMAEFIAEFAEIISRFTSLSEGKPVRFLGDCVMAIFGLHASDFPKELLAIEAACATHERFCLLRERWGARNPELANVGLGFGVTSGAVVAGRFGSAELSEYSVIGEAVNLASRLQGEAQDGEIVVSEEVASGIGRSVPGLVFRRQALTLKGIGDTTGYVLKAAEAHGVLRRIHSPPTRAHR